MPASTGCRPASSRTSLSSTGWMSPEIGIDISDPRSSHNLPNLGLQPRDRVNRIGSSQMSRLSRGVKRAAGLAFALGFFGSVGSAQTPAGAPWDQSYIDPHPAADGDLVLPLPCGGAMAFRRVEVESGGWLNDMQVTLGGSV